MFSRENRKLDLETNKTKSRYFGILCVVKLIYFPIVISLFLVCVPRCLRKE